MQLTFINSKEAIVYESGLADSDRQGQQALAIKFTNILQGRWVAKMDIVDLCMRVAQDHLFNGCQ